MRTRCQRARSSALASAETGLAVLVPAAEERSVNQLKGVNNLGVVTSASALGLGIGKASCAGTAGVAVAVEGGG